MCDAFLAYLSIVLNKDSCQNPEGYYNKIYVRIWIK